MAQVPCSNGWSRTAADARYRAIFDQVAMGIEEVARDGRLLMVNGTICSMLGYERDELLQKTTEDITHPDDRAEHLRLHSQLWTGEARSYRREQRYLRSDGSDIWVKVTSSLVETSGGNSYELSIVEDITERRQLEEQFRQAHKMEAIGRLAAGIAHDFNNLLTTILGYADLASEQMQPDDRLRHDIEAIQNAAGMAASLTRQMLAFSRKQTLAPRVLDLNSVVATVDTLLRRVIGEDVALDVRKAAERLQVSVDPGQLEQVLLNLAVNARDAMPDGGTLRIETARVVLDGNFARTHPPSQPGAYVRLSVSDTGVGMTPEVQARIFEPFFTTKELGQGTGLGLSTVYGIVKQSNGYIWVSSVPGKGSRFDIYFPPAHCEPAVARMAHASPAREHGGRETVLLVEDDDDIRHVARRVLETRNYRVLTAANAAEAIDVSACHPGPIDLLLTDLVMPGQSGMMLAERIVNDRPETPVLYVSGYSADSVGRGGLGPDVDFLPKPYTPTALLKKVREVLDKG